MARTATANAISDYELQRQEKIAKNRALFKQLNLEAASTGLAPKKAAAPASRPAKKREPRKVKEAPLPTRTSSRLAGIQADSEVAKRKADQEAEVVREQERAKRQRVSDDISLGDALVAGQVWNQSGNFLRNVRPANPYERTFDVDAAKKTSSKELKELRERMSGLQLWERFEPNRIKITPERIYSLGFHPTADKALVFAGDKLGNLGVFDASQQPAEVKLEDDEDEDDSQPTISTFKIHTRTICAFQFSPSDSNALYSASYDSSIRKLDLAKGVAVEVYAPDDKDIDDPVSGVEVSPIDPHMLYYTTLAGRFGMHDMRASPGQGIVESLQLSEKKIGGFSLHPRHPHFVATASLDRTMKLWDLRKINGRGEWRLPALVGEHESKLSVSHASFNAAGQVSTASYDDTIKIYDFSACGNWKVGHSLTEEQMKPATVIHHNNQTGRWVTILRANWQEQPQDGIQKLVIGNMNRFVDVYSADGQQLAQLGGDAITAVPAVAKFHPTQDWIAAGTASGKLCLWQ